jgi:hypothetical protein
VPGRGVRKRGRGSSFGHVSLLPHGPAGELPGPYSSSSGVQASYSYQNGSFSLSGNYSSDGGGSIGGGYQNPDGSYGVQAGAGVSGTAVFGYILIAVAS